MGRMPADGCWGEAEWISGEITDRCPLMWARDYSVVFTAAHWLERGVLPHAGGWADQPAVLMELAGIVIDEHRKSAPRH